MGLDMGMDASRHGMIRHYQLDDGDNGNQTKGIFLDATDDTHDRLFDDATTAANLV